MKSFKEFLTESSKVKYITKTESGNDQVIKFHVADAELDDSAYFINPKIDGSSTVVDLKAWNSLSAPIVGGNHPDFEKWVDGFVLSLGKNYSKGQFNKLVDFNKDIKRKKPKQQLDIVTKYINVTKNGIKIEGTRNLADYSSK